jgi:hypothetical protein
MPFLPKSMMWYYYFPKYKIQVFRYIMLKHNRNLFLGIVFCVATVFLPTACNNIREIKKEKLLSEYRIPITIKEASGTDLKDYQIKIDLQGANPNEPNCIDFSRINPDASNISFKENNGKAINFWIKLWDYKNKKATIWIKVPEIPAGRTVNTYLYTAQRKAEEINNYNKSAINNPLSSFDNTMAKLSADNDTKGLWHMDEKLPIILDSSKYKNNSLEIKALRTGYDGGQLGREKEYNFTNGDSLYLDGKGSYAEIPFKQSLDFTGKDEISLEAWVKPLTNLNYAPIIAKTGCYALYINPAGKLTSYFYGPKPEKYYYSNTTLLTYSWHHVAAVYNGQKLRFYINGILDSEFDLQGKFVPCLDRIHNIEYQKSSLYFGYDPLSPGNLYFSGIIDEILISGRVLLGEEIKSDFERRKSARSEQRITIMPEEKVIQ